MSGHTQSNSAKIDGLAEWLVKHRLLLAIFGMSIAFAVLSGVSRVGLELDYKLFFDEADPNLVAYEKQQSEFTRSENVLFVIEPHNGEVFTKPVLVLLEELTTEAWRMPYSVRVDSLANFQYTQAQGDELDVLPLFEFASTMNEKQIADARTIALAAPELNGLLLSNDASVTAINVRVTLDADTFLCEKPNQSCGDPSPAALRAARDKAAAAVVQRAEELRLRMQYNYPATIRLMGTVLIDQAFNQSTTQDVVRMTPLVLLLIALIVLFTLRSAMATLITLVFICTGIVMLVGCAGWLGFRLNMVSALGPVVVMTLAMSGTVHLFTVFFSRYYVSEDQYQAAVGSLSVNLRPLSLASITTAIGFLALNFSESPPFQQLGTLVACAVLITTVLLITVMPLVFVGIPMTRQLRQPIGTRTLGRLLSWVSIHRGRILVITLVSSVVTTSLIGLNQINDGAKEYFRPSNSYRQAADFTEQRLTGAADIAFALPAGGENAIQNPGYLKQVGEFVDFLRADPHVAHVSSYTDVLKRINQGLNGGGADAYRIPDTRELAAQYQLLYEISLPQGLDLNTLMNFHRSALKISVRLRGLRAKELIAWEQRAQQWLLDNAPELHSRGAGLSLMFAHIGQRNVQSMLIGSAWALLCIAVALMLFMRSIRFGLLSILPNLLPALVSLGVWGLIDGNVNLAVAVVFSMSLGVIVDDSVYLLVQYQRARQVLNYPPLRALRRAFQEVGSALLITTVSLTAGFLVLMLSDFAVFSIMGGLVALTIVVALAFDLLSLPALLLWLESRHQVRSRPVVSSTAVAQEGEA